LAGLRIGSGQNNNAGVMIAFRGGSSFLRRQSLKTTLNNFEKVDGQTQS